MDQAGRLQAMVLGERLRGRTFMRAVTSPLSRASETCRLVGLGEQARGSDDLMELHGHALED